MLRVFLSSTFHDLKGTRSKLIQRIVGSLYPLAMENFIAQDSDVQEVIFFDKDTGLVNSDICIFLITTGYGSLIDKCTITSKCQAESCPYKKPGPISPKDKISYTHCEFRFLTALKRSHQTYVFMDDWTLLFKLKELDWDPGSDSHCTEILERLGIPDLTCPRLTKIIEKKEYLENFWTELSGEHFQRITDENIDEFDTNLENNGIHLINEDTVDRVTEGLANFILTQYLEKRIIFSEFAGRREELQQIIKILTEGNSVLVWGIGGIGKTTLIHIALLIEHLKGNKIIAIGLEQCYNSGSGYVNQQKINASLKYNPIPYREIKDKKIFLSDVADALEIPQNDRPEGRELRDLIVWVMRKEKVILFIDDIHTADQSVQALMNMKIPIVATSRTDIHGSQKIPLGPLSEPDQDLLITVLANRLLMKRSEEIPHEIREKLRITAGGHPVVIHLLLNNYGRLHIESFNNIQEVLKDANPGDTDQVLDRIVREILDEKSFLLLRFLSILNPRLDENINRNYVEDISHIHEAKLLFNRLIECGFVRRNDQLGRYEITFRQIQQAVMSEDPVVHFYAVLYYSQFSSINQRFDLQIELLYHNVMSEFHQCQVEEYISLTNNAEIQDTAYYRLIDIGRQLLEKTQENQRGQVYYCLGKVLFRLGKCDEASNVYKEAIIIFTNHHEHITLIDVLVDYGRMLRNIGDKTNAEVFLKRAFELLNNQEKSNVIPEFFKNIFQLVMLYFETGRSNEAENYCQQAQYLWKKIAHVPLEDYNLSLAYCLSNVPALFIALNKKEEAEIYGLQALEIHRNLVLREPECYNPSYAESLSKFAITIEKLGKYEEAITHHLHALKIFRNLARKSPERYNKIYADSLMEVSSTYEKIGKIREAEMYGLKALKIFQDLAKKSPEAYILHYTLCLEHLGCFYNALNNKEETQKYFFKAVHNYQILSEKNPSTYRPAYADILNHLALFYLQYNDYTTAEEYFYTALEIYQNLIDSDPKVNIPIYNQILQNLAKICADTCRPEKAEEFLFEVLDFEESEK